MSRATVSANAWAIAFSYGVNGSGEMRKSPMAPSVRSCQRNGDEWMAWKPASIIASPHTGHLARISSSPEADTAALSLRASTHGPSSICDWCSSSSADLWLDAASNCNGCPVGAERMPLVSLARTSWQLLRTFARKPAVSWSRTSASDALARARAARCVSMSISLDRGVVESRSARDDVSGHGGEHQPVGIRVTTQQRQCISGLYAELGDDHPRRLVHQRACCPVMGELVLEPLRRELVEDRDADGPAQEGRDRLVEPQGGRPAVRDEHTELRTVDQQRDGQDRADETCAGDPVLEQWPRCGDGQTEATGDDRAGSLGLEAGTLAGHLLCVLDQRGELVRGGPDVPVELVVAQSDRSAIGIEQELAGLAEAVRHGADGVERSQDRREPGNHVEIAVSHWRPLPVDVPFVGGLAAALIAVPRSDRIYSRDFPSPEGVVRWRR